MVFFALDLFSFFFAKQRLTSSRNWSMNEYSVNFEWKWNGSQKHNKHSGPKFIFV